MVVCFIKYSYKGSIGFLYLEGIRFVKVPQNGHHRKYRIEDNFRHMTEKWFKNSYDNNCYKHRCNAPAPVFNKIIFPVPDTVPAHFKRHK